MMSLMKCRDINWRVQVTLQKTLIHNIMMCSSEARTLPKQAMNKIDSFEWKNPPEDIWTYQLTSSMQNQI
jgi:hypothetical protein